MRQLACVWWAVALTGCAGPPPAPPPVATATPIASPAPAAPDPPDTCDLRLVEPPGPDDDRPGAAYALVDDGILRITAAGASLLPAEKDRRAILRSGPRGSVWLADATSVRVLDADADALRVVAPALRLPDAGFVELIPRSASDIWGLVCIRCSESDTQWAVVHHDGRSWRHRDYTAFGDSPKRRGLAATSEGIWLTTSEGTWRAADGDWRRVDDEDLEHLTAAGDALIATYRGRPPRFVVRGTKRDLRAPDTGDARVAATSPAGLLVWWDDPTLHVGSLESSCAPMASDGLGDRYLLSAAVDGQHRVWVGTAHGLVVLAPTGEVLADYLPGTLPGLAGWVRSVAVPSRGPAALPPARAARRMDIVGRLVVQGAPIVGATIRVGSGRVFRVQATTAQDGSFRLRDLPDHSGMAVVELPRRPSPGCDEETLGTMFSLSTTEQCPDEKLVDGVCDLGAFPVVCSGAGRFMR